MVNNSNLWCLRCNSRCVLANSKAATMLLTLAEVVVVFMVVDSEGGGGVVARV